MCLHRSGTGRWQALCGIPLGPLSGHPVVLRSVGHVLCGDAAHQRVSWKGSRGRGQQTLVSLPLSESRETGGSGKPAPVHSGWLAEKWLFWSGPALPWQGPVGHLPLLGTCARSCPPVLLLIPLVTFFDRSCSLPVLMVLLTLFSLFSSSYLTENAGGRGRGTPGSLRGYLGRGQRRLRRPSQLLPRGAQAVVALTSLHLAEHNHAASRTQWHRGRWRWSTSSSALGNIKIHWAL